MLPHQINEGAHTREGTPSADARAVEQRWSITPPQHGAKSLADLAHVRQWLRPGDVVYVIEARRQTLTEADLNEAARAVIGGAA